MKEFEVTVTVRNNRLKERRDALGLSRRELAEKAGVSPSAYGYLEAMKDAPVSRTSGAWRPCVLRLAAFFGVKPDDLFPPAVLNVETPESSFVADGADLVRLSALSSRSALALPPDPESKLASEETRETLDALIEMLPKNEQLVIKRRFGLDGQPATREQIGAELKVTASRVAQIEARAIRRLRRPRALGTLRTAVGDGAEIGRSEDGR